MGKSATSPAAEADATRTRRKKELVKYFIDLLYSFQVETSVFNDTEMASIINDIRLIEVLTLERKPVPEEYNGQLTPKKSYAIEGQSGADRFIMHRDDTGVLVWNPMRRFELSNDCAVFKG